MWQRLLMRGAYAGGAWAGKKIGEGMSARSLRRDLVEKYGEAAAEAGMREWERTKDPIHAIAAAITHGKSPEEADRIRADYYRRVAEKM